MADFDYGNARLRAMKSRLLEPRELRALVESHTLPGLVAALTQTAYRKSVEVALTRASDMDCIMHALRIDLVSTLGNIKTFYHDDAGQMVNIVMRTYDLQNLKAVLRGLDKNVPPSEILSTLLPVGELKYSTLVELTRAPRPRGAIDMLASMNLPVARPLLRLRAEHPGARVADMELALDQWHFQEATDYLKKHFRTEEVLLAALKLDADITNLLTAIRFAQSPEERKMLDQQTGVQKIQQLFVGPGRLPFALLERAASQDTVEAAIDLLTGTVYEESLQAGLRAYSRLGRLSDFEKSLERYRLIWMRGLIARYPLGIGVVLGYLALKINEISNIRWIAHGINLDLKPEAIWADLEMAA